VNWDDLDLVCLDQTLKAFAISRHAKEPVFLSHDLKRDTVLRAPSVVQIREFVKLLAADAIKALIALSIEVAIPGARVPQRMNASNMSRIRGCTNECIVRNLELPAELFEAVGILSHEVGHRTSCCFRGANVFQTVVIRTALKPDVFAQKSRMAGVGIGLHKFERKTNMWRGIDVWNRGGDVSRRAVHRDILVEAQCPSRRIDQ